VNRQPFGGMKLSAFGGGIKAGGRNYVSCFVNIVETAKAVKPSNEKEVFKAYSTILNAAENARFLPAVDSYDENYRNEFSQENDIHNLMGERNTFRYLPLKKVALRILAADNMADIFMVLAAAQIVRTPIEVSISEDDFKLEVLKNIPNKLFKLIIQSETEFLNQLSKYDRIRTCGNPLPEAFYKKAAETGKYIAAAKPLIEGRLELLHYVKEQSIAFEYHRYGSITDTKE
jgi:RHH-type proline utilization regulon transcriptional repressor/proline dehydrogenase/delta 1-pyrroline-5-carboxylate dehydrogenase